MAYTTLAGILLLTLPVLALPTIPGLSADYLDGLDSTAFAAAAHDHDARYYTEGESDARFAAAGHLHDDRYLGIEDQAADSDTLDGLDSGAFLRRGEVVSSAAGMRIPVYRAARGPGPMFNDCTFHSTPGLTLTVDVPGPSVLDITGSGMFWNGNDGNMYSHANIFVDGERIGGGAAAIWQGGDVYVPFATTDLVPVAAGTHSVELRHLFCQPGDRVHEAVLTIRVYAS